VVVPPVAPEPSAGLYPTLPLLEMPMKYAPAASGQLRTSLPLAPAAFTDVIWAPVEPNSRITASSPPVSPATEAVSWPATARCTRYRSTSLPSCPPDAAALSPRKCVESAEVAPLQMVPKLVAVPSVSFVSSEVPI